MNDEVRDEQMTMFPVRQQEPYQHGASLVQPQSQGREFLGFDLPKSEFAGLISNFLRQPLNKDIQVHLKRF